jgi:hypothetical protein
MKLSTSTVKNNDSVYYKEWQTCQDSAAMLYKSLLIAHRFMFEGDIANHGKMLKDHQYRR